MAVNAAAFDFGAGPAKPEPPLAGSGFGEDKPQREPALDFSSPVKQDPYQHMDAGLTQAQSYGGQSYGNTQAYGQDGGANAYDETNYNYYG